jgi:peptide deformylase
MLDIRKYKDRVLFEKAREVTEDEFGEELESLLSDMAFTMYGSRGVGLAGPQVGDSRRILVADFGYVVGEDYGTNLVKMVNPRVVSSSVEEANAEEGCSSDPGLAVKVNRPIAIHVKFFSPSGEEESRTFNDWQARIIQHELDHLDGVTLYSRASNFKRTRYDKQIKKARL